MQVVVLRNHPKAIVAKPARKLDIDPKTFSEKHGMDEHLARRILSISNNGDQARAIAELMK